MQYNNTVLWLVAVTAQEGSVPPPPGYCLLRLKPSTRFLSDSRVAFHQCLVSTSSARRLSLFRVSYPTTMSNEVGVEEMMRADRPLVIPQTPSSASSCLKVSMTDDRPSTCSTGKCSSADTDICREKTVHFISDLVVTLFCNMLFSGGGITFQISIS